MKDKLRRYERIRLEALALAVQFDSAGKPDGDVLNSARVFEEWIRGNA